MRMHGFGYLLVTLLAGCSGAVASETGSADQDATGKHKGDHGAPSDAFPAFTNDAPQIKNNGGSVLARPSLVTVTWSSDPNAQTFEELYQDFLASPYSYATAARYRNIIHTAINTQNWSLIGLSPSSVPSAASTSGP